MTVGEPPAGVDCPEPDGDVSANRESDGVPARGVLGVHAGDGPVLPGLVAPGGPVADGLRSVAIDVRVEGVDLPAGIVRGPPDLNSVFIGGRGEGTDLHDGIVSAVDVEGMGVAAAVEATRAHVVDGQLDDVAQLVFLVEEAVAVAVVLVGPPGAEGLIARLADLVHPVPVVVGDARGELVLEAVHVRVEVHIDEVFLKDSRQSAGGDTSKPSAKGVSWRICLSMVSGRGCSSRS